MQDSTTQTDALLPSSPSAEAVEARSPGTPVAHFRGNVRTSFQEASRSSPTGNVEKFLKIAVVLCTPDGLQVQAIALVDTGAEVNLLKRGLIPDSYAVPARRRLKLLAANDEVIDGVVLK